eukprot:CAMPEP_0185771474 /NCGR_PEP_ID=MMETSP1174-20130828/64324_1 /TAXON_ID=35687 /ORGANISM="Dictyocha speculum, Strain CCMP1381" /LENGTH=640 /DNA_ID=CAMNT_0028457357 /DNA_START=300 /DNA_END=2222 /DNA_ORIENTATION=-
MSHFFSDVKRCIRERKPRVKKTKSQRPTGEWARLWRLAAADKNVMLVSVVSLVLAAVCDAAVPHYSAMALTAVTASDSNRIVTSIRSLVGVSMGSALFTGLRGAFFTVAGARVVTRLRDALFTNLLKQEVAFFDAHDTGELTSRLNADAAKLANVVSYHVNIIVRQTITATIGLGYLFVMDPLIATYTLSGLVFMSIMSWLNGSFSRWLSEKLQDEVASANSVAEQSLSLVRVVRAHTTEKTESKRYRVRLAAALALQETQGVAYGLTRSLSVTSGLLVTLSVLLGGRQALTAGRLTAAQLTSFLFYATFVSGATFDVGDQWTKIQEALGAGTTIFDLLERKSTLKTADTHNSNSAPTTAAHHLSPEGGSLDASAESSTAMREEESSSEYDNRIRFEGVHFAYPTRKGQKILQGLNLDLKSGEVVGLVGGSGGGKSTVLRLLLHLYDPDEGRILIGDRDVASIPQAELSQRIAMVTQEPQLFPISIAENIAYGLPEGCWTMDQVKRAAVLANVDSFVKNLPEGYATPVGEGGASLSGGQKQRVAIARAIIRDPAILVLDEPTSALDGESEALVLDALETAFEGRTVIVIAHRLSTIARADRIVVLQSGRNIEEGSPLELKEKPQGAYAKLLQPSSTLLPQ